MPYSFSYAPTNRAGCKGVCKEKIPKGAVRLGVSSDGFGDFTMMQFRCLNCVTPKQIQNIKSSVGDVELVEGFTELQPEHQNLVMETLGVAPKAKAKARGKPKAEAPPARPAKAAAPPARAAPKAAAPPARAAPKAPAPTVKEQHAFLDASKNYDFEKVKALVEEKPGLVNAQPAGRWSALHQFAANGNEEAVTFLLENGADADAKTKDGQTVYDVATDTIKEKLDDWKKAAEEPAEEEMKVDEGGGGRMAPDGAADEAAEPEAAGGRAAPDAEVAAGREAPDAGEEAPDAGGAASSTDGRMAVDTPAASSGGRVAVDSGAASSSTTPAPAARGGAPAAGEEVAKRGGKRKIEPVAAAPSPVKKVKTGPPVDAPVPGREGFSVVDDWSVLLNQTNVGANNNKFYRIQVLRKNATDEYYCWTRWGRVGAQGQNNLEMAGGEEGAKNAFRTKFKQKSGIHYWMKDAHDWTPVMGKYTLVETDDQEGADGGGDAPLGKLTPQQIEKGQAILEKFDAALDKGKVYELQSLSSQYYTLIPHNFGFAVPPTINTSDMVEAEQELLKFYLRMGFEQLEERNDGLTPVSGIMDLDLPPSLEAAAGKLCSAKDVKASNDKGKTHATKQSGSPTQKMEAHLYGAIMLYTSNAIYQDLNKVLRSEDRSKVKRYFLYLRLLLEALNRLPQENKTLWRGIGVDLYDQYPKGSTITWWGVSSCTADINVAKNFMKGVGGKCTLLTVHSKTAADISEITFFGNEKESLLAPGTQLKVKSAVRNGNLTEITMEEVGRELG